MEAQIKRMEAKIGKLLGTANNFFAGGDQIPWTDSNIVSGCERDVKSCYEAECSSDVEKSDCVMRFLWALVHSKHPADVQRGIAMLEDSLGNGSNSPSEKREKLYLLSIGFYRSGNYSKSRQLVERCLEIEPGWSQALSLKKAIEAKITKDGVIGIGIAATAVSVLAGGLAVALSARKK